MQRLLMSIWLGLAGASPLMASGSAQSFVLSIGIEQFADEFWRDLSFAGKDAGDIYDALPGFRGEGSRVIRQSSVTKDLVWESLRQLQKANRNEDDTVVVYISSHGTVGYKADGRIGRYIITSDTQGSDLRNTSIDYDEFLQAFKSLRSRKKVLILAFCHSGVGKSALTPEMKKSLAMLKSSFFEEPIYQRSEGTLILTASGWREPALEHPDLGNDVYTHYLIEGMDQDANDDGLVSIMEAHGYATAKTYEFTKGRQRPSAIVELLGTDPIVVRQKVAKPKDTATLFSLFQKYAGLRVRLDGQLIGAVEKGVAVEPGYKRLTLVNPENDDVVTDRVIYFESGREYALDSLVVPTFPNSLQIGPAAFAVTDSQTRESYFPGNLTGWEASYRRAYLLGANDIGLLVRYFPSVTETVLVDSGENFEQKRSTMQAHIPVVRRMRVGFLSTQDNSMITESYVSVSPGVLYVEREVDDPAFAEKSVKKFAPGIGVRTGLEWTLPYYLLKLSANASWYGYVRVVDDNNPVTGSVAGSVALGTFW